ncbi:MAG TPA: c-type cytochrome [Candidatus Acidoferrales bacterium]|nr:c-type cytochrome [Candidatus Acidoferrales bacterium]
MNRIPAFASAILSCLLFAAAALPQPTGNQWIIRAIAQAPPKASARQNPYDSQTNAVLAGKKLYRQHCAECHGDDARGIGRAADLHSPGVQNATPGQLEWLLRNGNLPAGMPSWSGLPEERRWQIVAYLKTLR